MKKYIKPTFEFVEFRPEEGLANSGSGGNGNCASGNNVCFNPGTYHK